MLTPKGAQQAPKIAIYWDFENIHSGIQNDGEGRPPAGSPRQAYRASGRMVDVKAVMDYLNSLGDVVINRAYANWIMLKNYRFILLEHSVDLIQLFPRGPHAKNGADIRMALDAMEDIVHYGDVDVQVIIGGDSDFSGVAQKLRMHGKYVVGIGARNSSNIYWIKSCNEFKYYHTLVTRAEDAEDGAASADQRPDFDGAMDLLERAVGRLARSHDGRVPLIAVRPLMIRLDPSFDENDYGHDNMKAFVEACRDVVRLDDTPDGAIVTLVSDAEAFTVDVDSPEEMENLYRNTLRRIQYRLLPPEERLHALDVLHEILKENAPVEDQAAVKELLMDRFEKDGRPIGDEEAQHVWDMGFKANAYYFQDYPFRNIVINENVTSPDALRRRADSSVIRRLLGKCPVQPLDAKILAAVLYGPDADKEAYVAELIGESAAKI